MSGAVSAGARITVLLKKVICKQSVLMNTSE